MGKPTDNADKFFEFDTAWPKTILILSLLAIVGLASFMPQLHFALPLVWVFDVVGLVDLLNAPRHAEAVPDLGATWNIPIFWVPMLLVTHIMVFTRLI